MFGINMNQNVEEDDLFKKPDPYSMPMKGAMQDPYQYELEPKKKQYDYDPAKTIGKPGNKFNNPVPLIGEEVEEDINFGESREDKTKHSVRLVSDEELALHVRRGLQEGFAVDGSRRERGLAGAGGVRLLRGRKAEIMIKMICYCHLHAPCPFAQPAVPLRTRPPHSILG